MSPNRTTLDLFLIQELKQHPSTSGDLSFLINNVAVFCEVVADRLARGALGDADGVAEPQDQRAAKRMITTVANDIFRSGSETGGHLAGMVLEEFESPIAIPQASPNAHYLLNLQALDGSSNIDVNLSVGSIFSILRAPRPAADVATPDFLQAGRQQVCAGYAIYGPSTMLVITVGAGVHGFTLDPNLDEFILTHPAMRVPAAACEFAINASNSRFWEPAVRRYVTECLAGQSGPRRKDFNMRWVASLVAEIHCILVCGGVFLHPRDDREPQQPGRLHLLCEANPIAFLIEQAGGAASTGRERILDVAPTGLHQRVPLIFGAREEVETIEAFYRELGADNFDAPLFSSRGLFRATA